MNRKDFEEAVWASELNPTARSICMAYAGYQDYKATGDEGVWPAKTTVAKRTGYSDDTVGKYVEALIETGWFVVIGACGEANRVKVVTLSTGQSGHHLLSTRRRGQSHSVLTKQVIPCPVGDASPNPQEMHPLTGRSPSPIQQERITIEQPEEQSEEQPSTSADAPAPVEDKNDPLPTSLIPRKKKGWAREKLLEASKTRRNVPTPLIPDTSAGTASNMEEEAAKAKLDEYDQFQQRHKHEPLTEEQHANAMTLMLDASWQRPVKSTTSRAIEAYKEVTYKELVW